jgi:hypothetical protein
VRKTSRRNAAGLAGWLSGRFIQGDFGSEHRTSQGYRSGPTSGPHSPFHNFRSHLHVPAPVSQLAFPPQKPEVNMLLQSLSPEHVHSLFNVFSFHPHEK